MNTQDEQRKSNVNFKKAVEKATEKVEEYEEDPTRLIGRSSMLRQSKQMTENLPPSMPKQVTDPFDNLKERIQKSKPVPWTASGAQTRLEEIYQEELATTPLQVIIVP